MDWGSIVLSLLLIIGVVFIGLYFLNRWALRRMNTQQEMVERSKQTMTIYVIDKKKDKAANVNLPKAVTEQLPRMYKIMKMPFVKAKIGSQIMTLMCEKKVFDALPVKKNVKVDMAGIYIVGVKGMKTEKELKALAKDKKEKAKSEKQKDKQKVK